MTSELMKGIYQLSDPASQKVVWMSGGTAVLAFAALWAVIVQVLAETALFEAAWMERLPTCWVACCPSC